VALVLALNGGEQDPQLEQVHFASPLLVLVVRGLLDGYVGQVHLQIVDVVGIVVLSGVGEPTETRTLQPDDHGCVASDQCVQT